jgi:major membrane immunogen (membrane-anchored lipoprotein)
MNRATRLPIRAAVVAVAAILALSGCKKLDLRKLESAVKTEAEAQTGIKVASVKCPESREIKKGDTFECTLTAEDGSAVAVNVEQTDGDGNVRWVVADTLDLRKLETVVAADFAEKTGVAPASVTCPMLRPIAEGDTFECKATADDGSYAVLTILQTDDQGNFHWSVKETSEAELPAGEPAAE